MDIKHRININTTDPNFLSTISDLRIAHKAIQLPGGGGRLITIIILESNPHWDTVVQLVKKQTFFEIYGNGDQFETIFSDDEIKEAEWLRLISTFEQGYPQPKPHWPLKQLSYEILCPECAIYKQTNPMRLAKEPSLRKKSFMSLIWTTEILCTPEVLKGLAEIQARGYENWDAIIHKTGVPSKNVRQVYVPDISSPGVVIDEGLKRKTCDACGTTRYYPHLKGKMFIKKDALLPNTDFMLSNEWFGHGLLSWREIFVSNKVARLVLDKDWQGVRFKVVELV
jgi:hypothetical protein